MATETDKAAITQTSDELTVASSAGDDAELQYFALRFLIESIKTRRFQLAARVLTIVFAILLTWFGIWRVCFYSGALERELADCIPIGDREHASMTPDYVDCVAPKNIAPMNFEIREEGNVFLTRFSIDGESFFVTGRRVAVGPKRWKRLMESAVGKSVKVEIFSRNKRRSWRLFKPFSITVSADTIDPWLHYRLIEPGYELFNRVTLVERNMETFDERVWFDAKAVNNRTCVNCHSFQDHKTDNFLLHTRRACSGTILCRDGVVKKIESNVPTSPLGAAYAAWNPRYPYVAFSSNSTFQTFHSLSPDRIDVIDAASDLVLFDVDSEKSESICNTDDLLETFPSWSPDGKTLYYCVAKSPYSKGTNKDSAAGSAFDTVFGDESSETLDRRRAEAVGLYADFHYGLVKRTFDPQTRRFGEPETLIDAEKLGKSVAHPRVSPDGKTLIYTLSKYGTFPIWRRDSDLWALDLTTGETRELTELNSPEADSWHEWDSSGRWLIVSSRRYDGTFTRVYLSHCGDDGTWSKPLLLPQRFPRRYFRLTKSFNLPTPTVEPIKIRSEKLLESARNERSDAQAGRAK